MLQQRATMNTKQI